MHQEYKPAGNEQSPVQPYFVQTGVQQSGYKMDGSKIVDTQQQQLIDQQSHQQNVDQLYQHQQVNQQDLLSSVSNFHGFYNDQLGLIELNPLDSDHPGLALFQFIIKAAPIISYYFLGLLITATWTVPEIIIVLSAVDFWVTKNIAGRMLVGLRWWEEIDEVSGKQMWVFECRVDETQNKYEKQLCHNFIRKVNEGIFWITQLTSVTIWGILTVTNALSLNIINTISVGFALITNFTNLYFFYKCSKVQKVRAQQLAQVLGQDMVKKMMNTSVIWPMTNPFRNQ